MAFPFYVYNIAHPAAGRKSQTQGYCYAIEKRYARCPLVFLSGDSRYQNTHRNASYPPFFEW